MRQLMTKLGVCMTELAKSIIKKDPEPARRLAELNRRRRQLNQHATGLQRTWVLYHYFDVDRHTGVQQSVFDLARVKWMGDSLEKVQQYMFVWSDTRARIKDPGDDSILRAFEHNMKQSNEFKETLRQFQELSRDHPNYNVGFFGR